MCCLKSPHCSIQTFYFSPEENDEGEAVKSQDFTLGAYEALKALTANVNFQHPVEISCFSTGQPLLHLFSLATDK